MRSLTPSLRRLFAGRTIASLATWLIPTTLTLAVVRATGSAGDLGLVLAAELLPMLVLLPVAGVFADRFRPQRVVLVADLVRAAAQAGIGVELLSGRVQVPVLAVLAGITGGAVAFGTPAVRTLVSAMVSGPERVKLNGQLAVWQSVAQLAAPGIAGALILGVGAGWSSLLTALLFVGSALTVGGLKSTVRQAPRTGSTFGSELREGWAETRRHPWFLANVLGHGVWHLSAGILLTLGPVIAVRRLGGGSAWVVIAQAGTAGMLAGVLTARRLPVRRPLVWVAVGAAAYAAPLLAFATGAPMAVVTASYLLAMFGLGILSPLWETTMQQRIPAESLGRVGSFDTLISFAARPLGLAVAAPLAAAVGTTIPLLTAAALVGAANLAVLALPDVRLPSQVRERQPVRPEADSQPAAV
jgi:hypothetical protein